MPKLQIRKRLILHHKTHQGTKSSRVIFGSRSSDQQPETVVPPNGTVDKTGVKPRLTTRRNKGRTFIKISKADPVSRKNSKPGRKPRNSIPKKNQEKPKPRGRPRKEAVGSAKLTIRKRVGSYGSRAIVQSGRPNSRRVVRSNPESDSDSETGFDSESDDDADEPRGPGKLYVMAGLFSKATHGSTYKKDKLVKVKLPENRDLLKVKSFKIPYDVYCPSPKRIRKIGGWKTIKRNIFISSSRSELINSLRENYHGKHSSFTQCVCEDRCDENCLNRIMQVECEAGSCGVEQRTGIPCENRPFSTLAKQLAANKAYAAGYEVVSTGNKGNGLRATRSYKPHDLIIEYIGEVLDQKEVAKRLKDSSRLKQLGPSHFYFLSLEKGLSIDSKKRGSLARFVNHSCSPNSEMQKWYILGEPRIGLFAGPNGVSAGEEITYDYNFDWFPSAEPQKCLCGSPRCRGTIGKRSSKQGSPPSLASPPAENSRKHKHDKGKDSKRPKKRAFQEATPPSSPVTENASVKDQTRSKKRGRPPKDLKMRKRARHEDKPRKTLRAGKTNAKVEIDAAKEPTTEKTRRYNRRHSDDLTQLAQTMPHSLMRSLRIDMAPPGNVVDDITRELVQISKKVATKPTGIPQKVQKKATRLDRTHKSKHLHAEIPKSSRFKEQKDDLNKIQAILKANLAKSGPSKQELNRLTIDDKPPLVLPRGNRASRKPVNYHE
ncbi:unnamed protein product [Kuraishia capsulata CBS 1993]|uniref:Histone-lysine N-methyltransferase n=1 Tax=Kuraishia capsulata CBS 1993 TaxID=1382522 RepID=W6MM04_9ASCO|nr:uncharacterized protein KUCA_T00003504001 [Kuraishia capsulata CBS 1993]CDK27526.1 unnamed protein product [Kuraishia capsulata CBS 1993]